MRSTTEIFDSYAAIALEQGLISIAENTDDSRIGSDDISTIEALYGIKPNGKEEKSMMEQAHPEPVVIAPSYDRLNGLVENEIERHNMIMNVLNKPHQAKLTQHRYANAEFSVSKHSKELMDELIRVGFLMDNQNQLELMSLADSCTESLQKTTIQKTAILPWLAVAAGLSLIGTYNNFAYLSQGVANDCDNAIEAIEKFAQQVPDISSQLFELNEGIRYVKALHEQAMRLSANFKNINNDNVIKGAVNVGTSAGGQQAFKLLEQYKRAASILADRIVRIYVPIIESTELPTDRSSSSIWTGLSSAWHALFGSVKNDVLKMLVGSNIDIIGQGGLVGSLRNSVQQITAKETAMKIYVEQNKGSLLEHLSEGESPDTEQLPPTSKESPEKKKLIDELKTDPSKGVSL